jgi:hypothetical protein
MGLNFFDNPGQEAAEAAPTGRARGMTGDNAQARNLIVYGPNPISAGMARRLFIGTTVVSPAVSGRFRPQDKGSPVNRGGNPNLGALQLFRGLVGKPMSLRLGAQAGPSSQPAYPGTNNTILAGLRMQGLPDVMPVRRP